MSCNFIRSVPHHHLRVILISEVSSQWNILVSVLEIFWFLFCDLEKNSHQEPFKVIGFSVIENPVIGFGH